ncbi:hypothetical protein COCNU_08G001080 [Cocos nucifera]|uniref:Uncharacterized protein n=1 Tax=Cocos nucifera TaxID=13894 RepID=A0A8K0N693_COCNU|nr:hypothetical protein COCNU_08G001080 [Cocos nucifera]
MGHQLIANIKAVNIHKDEAAKAIEAAQECKAKVGCLSTEVGHLQELLMREELAMVGLKAMLTSEEEKRKEDEVKIAGEGEQIIEATEKDISSFKSSEEIKNIKVTFAQETFVKGFDLF